MLALELRFLAGRYHATPWGRHVNEGEVAWPPDPWRLLRALIATWHHKIKHNVLHSEGTLDALIGSLAAAVPEYCLPAASHSHTRHYMPQWKIGDKSLVFDAFAAIDKEAPLYLRWPEIDLPDDQVALLDDLLAVMGYLGRAESWIEARRVDSTPPPDCIPGDAPIDQETGQLRGEVVGVHAPVATEVYDERRCTFLSDKKQAKKLAATLPHGLVGALSLDTADLQKRGWSQPPASQTISYIRPLDAMRPKRRRREEAPVTVTTARFLLVGKPLPRIEDSLRIGELLRWAAMSAFGKDETDRYMAPPIFSGHDLPTGNRHQHAFYLPFDSTGDGRLDRALIHVPAGFSGSDRQTIEHLHKIWDRSGGQWKLILENVGGIETGGDLMKRSKHWVSVTPYLHPWHVKRNFSVKDQIRRECHERGFVPPVHIDSDTVIVNGIERRPIHYRRFRSKRGLAQPDRQGSFWKLEFSEPVHGPLALGFGCHFGLGLFKPAITRN